MKKNKLSINLVLKKLLIKKGDNLIIHGDAGAIEQLNLNNVKKFKYFSDEVIKYLGKDGTILIPSFTYSFCKKKIFNPLLNKSEVGLFSEKFRKLKNYQRTDHPIFSFSIYGKNKKYFKKSNYETCFGENSIFELFLKKNGKIISFGSSFEDSVTFLHFIEQSAKVKYRYLKKFEGIIKKNNKKKKIFTNYYVRDLKKNKSFVMPKPLFKIIKKASFGRYLVTSISSKKLYLHCMKKLKNDDNYLIKG